MVKLNRLGEVRKMNCEDYAKIVEYNNARDIIVEFQDYYKTHIHTTYQNFLRGTIKNPYCPSVYGVGMIGTKYKICTNRIEIKEYITWYNMLKRCFDQGYKEKYPTYLNTICCNEWLCFENFYEWLHSQNNFNKWSNNKGWSLDKDIIIKGNKIYEDSACCLVPSSVNNLFTKSNAIRGDLPIGVSKYGNMFQASCLNQFTGKKEYLGMYNTVENAFIAYKEYKERLIKQVAELEYSNGNIVEKCYYAMMKYTVDIDD